MISSQRYFQERPMFFLLDYNCTDLHQCRQKRSTKPLPRRRQTVVFSMAFLLQVWVFFSWRFCVLANCTRFMWLLTSPSLLPSQVSSAPSQRGALSHCPLSIGRAATNISYAGQPLWGNRCPLCLPVVELPQWKHGKGHRLQRFYPSGQVTVAPFSSVWIQLN